MHKGYALVTGASSGIGADFARQLAAAGYPLILTARRTDRLESLRAEILARHTVDIVILPQDLAVPAAAQELYAAVQERKLSVDILINNAGYGIQGQFLDMDMGQVEAMCQVNMLTLTALTQAFARDMKARGHGYILNVASAAAFLPTPLMAAYAATKAYVLSFSESLNYELQGSGVSVTTLYPGITTTEFNAVADSRTPGFMNASILPAAEVARIGLKAMFRRRRAVVSGKINKLNAFFSGLLPRGWVIAITGRAMKSANPGH